MSEANEQLVRRWFQQVWNEKRPSAIDEMFHAEGKSRGFPEPDSVLEGPPGFKAVHERFCGAFPDLTISIEDVISEGDRVAVRWRFEGTHQGDSLGFPPTGKKVRMIGSSFVRIKDGRLVEGWNYMDMQAILQKLREESAAAATATV